MAYVIFIQNNLALFQCEKVRRSCKVFMLMAENILTRTSDQCRSHHQKMINYHGSVDKILEYYAEGVKKGPSLRRHRKI
jgi:hypothetical protein